MCKEYPSPARLSSERRRQSPRLPGKTGASNETEASMRESRTLALAAMGLFVIPCIIWSCSEPRPSRRTLPSGDTPPHADPASSTRLTVGAPVVAGRLAVFPVYAPPSPPIDVVTLDEATERGWIVFSEKSEGGAVNTLEVENSGDKPVYLMSGEILKGGKQDRTIAADAFIPAKSGRVDVGVFCVERGRWTSDGDGNGSSNAYAPVDVNAAVNCRFQQQEVWSRVADGNGSMGCWNEDISVLYGFETCEKKAAQVALLETFLKRFKEMPGASGFVLAIDGRIVSADVLGHPSLCVKLRGKILRSYLLTAEVRGPGDAKPPPTVAEVENLLRTLLGGAVESRREGPYGASVILRGARGRLMETRTPDGSRVGRMWAVVE